MDYKVYIKTDNQNVVAVNSSAFLTDTDGWIEIDEGLGDRYHHAQGNYFLLPIVTDSGIYRYKYVDGEVVEKTAEEIEAEESNLPPPEPSQVEKMTELSQSVETLDGALFELLMNLPNLTGEF